MSKYRAIPEVIDGIRFPSRLEAARYRELKKLERAGEIRELRIHVKYPLKVGNKVVCNYIADSEYLDVRIGQRVTEDVKGVPTPVYKLKRKMFEAQYGSQIREITKKDVRL